MDPYEVLGVSPSASPEEIRSAYMALVKKYHPDRYQDSNLKKQAEDKMKKINAAYDMLTKKPSGGSSSSYGPGSSQSSYGTGYGSGSYGQGSYGQSSYGSQYSGQYAAEFAKVRSFLNAGSVAAAFALLNSIPLRNAEWNFLYGMCCYREGQYGKAYEYVSRACSMDPGNREYRSALYTMRGASESTRTWTTNGGNLGLCGICSALLCADALCGLCCRR